MTIIQKVKRIATASFVVLITFVFVSSVSGQSESYEALQKRRAAARELVSQAEVALENGRHLTVISLCSDARIMNSDRCVVMRAIIWSKQGEHRKSIDELAELRLNWALGKSYTYPESLAWLVSYEAPIGYYLSSNNSDIAPEDAVAALTKAIRIYPQYYEAYEARGDMLIKHQQLAAGTADLESAARYDNDKVRQAGYYFSIGDAYKKSGNTAQEIASYKKAISVDPKHKHSQVRLYWLGDPAGKPESEDLLWVCDFTGYAKFGYGGDDLRLKCTTDAITYDKSFRRAYSLRGNIYEERKQFALAAADYLKVVELSSPSDDEFASSTFQRALMLSLSGDSAGSIDWYTRFIKSRPNDPVGYNNRSWKYFQANKMQLAMEDVSRSIQLKPSINNLSNRAHYHRKLGNNPAAIADYKSVLKLDPNQTDALKALAELGATP